MRASRVNSEVLKLNARKKLLQFFDKYEGTKTIIWDENLSGPFGLIANYPLLKERDVVQMFKLEAGKVMCEKITDHYIYLVRKDWGNMRFIADNLLKADKMFLKNTTLVFVPQRCHSREMYLKQNLKVDLDNINAIDELDIELFVIDTDVLSMENDAVYREIHVEGDPTSMHHIVNSIIKIEEEYGIIPRIYGQGDAAKQVANMLVKRGISVDEATANKSSSIDSLLLIDRKIDLVPILLTQLTYEGLLDELFDIRYGTITLPSDKFVSNDDKSASRDNAESEGPKIPSTRKFELKSSDELYTRLRDCHINGSWSTLKISALQLQAQYDDSQVEGKSVHEIRKIVSRVPYLKAAKRSQATQTAIAELIKESILRNEFTHSLRLEHELLQQELSHKVHPDIKLKLLRHDSYHSVLRLVCLQSVVSGGLKTKVANEYKEDIIDNYGVDFYFLLCNLEKAGALMIQNNSSTTLSEKVTGGQPKSSYGMIKRAFNLIKEDVQEVNPDHISYVYGGCAPVSVCLAKSIVQPGIGWRAMSDNLRLLPGPTVETTQRLSSPSSRHQRRNSISSANSSNDDHRTVLVYFIGGCTFAEISALRFLSQQEENNCEFIVATTKIVNGRTFIDSLNSQCF
ncbi:Vacuolar protein sorting-associated protein 33A [Fragariocoptes setiger]|uniref:Vacuolar protein sorting-associated protein 33A n=1 Tax=Fragariocoptes setiger TaxID=1670756 RepID=A0ABQ7SCE2_9ACAR|nr:Vacuolar protein sorting-associated protein 33A [Fragariocoptes setiger]